MHFLLGFFSQCDSFANNDLFLFLFLFCHFNQIRKVYPFDKLSFIFDYALALRCVSPWGNPTNWLDIEH